jgi:hypothetical protein
MTPLCFIDTETTGLHTDRQVWEIAMIRRDDDGQQAEVSFMVDVDLSNADPFGLAVGRFYERHPHGRYLSSRNVAPDIALDADPVSPAWSRAQAAEAVAIWTHGAHLVGSVPNFDAETLAPLLREHGHIPAWHYHLIDGENLAVGYLIGRWAQAKQDAPATGTQVEEGPFDIGLPWKSDEISRAVGVEPPTDDERHTALGDARWAMRMYDAITGLERS